MADRTTADRGPPGFLQTAILELRLRGAPSVSRQHHAVKCLLPSSRYCRVDAQYELERQRKGAELL